MRDYLRIKIRASQTLFEEIYNTIYQYNSIPILEENNSVVLYFKKSDEKLNSLLAQLLKLDVNGIDIRKFNNKNWDFEWKKKFKPLIIKNKICIYQSWQKKHISKQKGIIYIQIDPKMSFGTGYNETTQLMLEMILKYLDRKTRFILDFGCGTGILAIAAAKLYACKGIAIDNDSDAIKNAKENITINKVSKLVHVRCATISNIRKNNFDAIFGNIETEILIDNLELIKKRLKPNGKLFVSGILRTEKNIFVNSLKEFKFEIINITDKSEWTGIYARKS
ncbi:MAG: 50S ribosomal protein L11 methyltransferase [Ignavibacteria bacterium]